MWSDISDFLQRQNSYLDIQNIAVEAESGSLVRRAVMGGHIGMLYSCDSIVQFEYPYNPYEANRLLIGLSL